MHELRNQHVLLVSSSVRSKQLLSFVHGQGQEREQKPTTKKVVWFHNHSRLLTMVELNLRQPETNPNQSLEGELNAGKPHSKPKL